MKKVLLILVIALATTHVAKAQPGAQAAVNLATFSGDDADEAEMLTGFYLGFLYNLMLSEAFGLTPEVGFSMQGATYDNDWKYKLNYINLALLARYQFLMGLYLATGPQMGFLMSSKLHYDGESEDIDDTFKGTSFDWAFAAGFNFAGGFGIFARYNVGLSNILDFDDGDLKNSVIQIGLRYMFMASKK